MGMKQFGGANATVAKDEPKSERLRNFLRQWRSGKIGPRPDYATSNANAILRGSAHENLVRNEVVGRSVRSADLPRARDMLDRYLDVFLLKRWSARGGLREHR